jgi:hypothetical protein
VRNVFIMIELVHPANSEGRERGEMIDLAEGNMKTCFPRFFSSKQITNSMRASRVYEQTSNCLASHTATKSKHETRHAICLSRSRQVLAAFSTDWVSSLLDTRQLSYLKLNPISRKTSNF